MARAERLPFDDTIFDAALTQLVVNFMTDAPAGVAEMRRVTRPGGVIAGCVWDYAGEMTLLRTFWDAARAIDPASAALDESATMSYCNRDGLRELWAGAGLRDLEVAVLRPSATYADFDSVWQPFRAGVGPAGAYAAGLNDAGQAALRDEFFRRLGRPTQPFVLSARAWAVAGRR